MKKVEVAVCKLVVAHHNVKKFQDNKLSYKEFCVMMNKKRNSDAKKEKR